MAARFWVGGTGTWDASSTTHWSASTGGASGASVPTSADDVTFDSASNATSYTVTLQGNANCASVIFNAPASGTLTATGSYYLNIYGNFTRAASGVSFGQFSITFNFAATATGKTITLNGGSLGQTEVRFDGVGGGWTLQDNLAILGGITLVNGSLNTNGKTVGTVTDFMISGVNTRSLTLGASSLDTSSWDATTTTGLTFDAGTSTIISRTSQFKGGGLTYNSVQLAANGVSQGVLTGSNTISDLTLSRTWGLAGDTTITVTAGTTQTITTSLTATSASPYKIILQSSSAGSAWTLSKSSGTVIVSGLSLQDSTATGGATWYAQLSTDVSGNSGWIFFNANVSETITVSESVSISLVQGPNSPGTMSDDATVGTVAWTSPDNAKVSDNVYATISLTVVFSHYLKATNFGFTIPAGATINGIIAEIERKYTSGSRDIMDSEVKIVKSNGTIGTQNKGKINEATDYWGAEAYYSYGSSSDLWGETWTAADINDVNFGVVLSAQGITGGSGPVVGSVDHIRITVYYAQNNPAVSIFDSVTVSEALVYDPDRVYVTDVPTVFIPTFLPSVFDSITVSENISINIPVSISVFDSVTVSDVPTIGSSGVSVSVFDSVTVSENISIRVTVSPSVFDSVTITENVNVNEVDNISVFDSVTVSESFATIVSPWQLISSGKTASTDTTSSVTLADITGSSFNVTLRNSGYIVSLMSVQTSSSISGTLVGYAININGVDSLIISRYNRTAGDLGNVGVVFRSSLLAAGTYAVKARHQTAAGIVTSTNAVLVANASMDDGGNSWSSDYVTVASASTASTTAVDIPGLTTSISDVVGQHMWSAISSSCSTDGTNDTYTLVSDIGGAQHQVSRFLSVGSDVGSTNIAARTMIPVTTTPVVVKGMHYVSANTATIAPVMMLAAARGLTAFGEDWTIPSTHVMTTGQSTTSATLVDIPGTSDQLSNRLTSHIIAHFTISLTGASGAVASLAINIDGTDYEVSQRTMGGLGKPGNVIVHTRTATPVAPGIHTVKARWAVSSGTLSSVDDVAITSFALETSLLVLEPVGIDTVTVSENTSFFFPVLNVVVGEDITVSDVPSVLLPRLVPSVFDLVAVSENIQLMGTEYGSIFESITVSEVVTLNITALVPSVFDLVTVSENIQITGIEYGSIFESITVSEALTLTIPTLVPSVFDSVTVSENIATTSNIPLSVFDLATVSENVSLVIPTSDHSFFESVVVSESVALTIPILFFSVFDSVTISENIQIAGIEYGSIFETITVSESVTIAPVLVPSVSDLVTVSENVRLAVAEYGSVFESITVSESVSLTIPILFVSVFDSVTVSEVYISGLAVIISENVLVTDLPTILIPTLFVPVSDSVVLLEQVGIIIPILVPSVSDSVTVSESLSLLVLAYVSVSDQITVSEVVSVLIPLLFPSVSDSVTVSESVVLLAAEYESIYEQITVSESVSVVVYNLLVSPIESITVSENVFPVLVAMPSVHDSTTISENLAFDTIIWVYEPKEFSPRGSVAPSTGLSQGGDAY